MADTVGEFLIKLGLDANGLDRQLNSVVGNVKSGLSNLMGGVVGPALAGLATGSFVQSFADEITQVSSLSDALGVNIETLSAWRTAAEMAGVEADEVGEIFADFNDWMVDAKFNEGGAMYTDFIQKDMLPSVTDANGEMKKTEDYILEFADALHNMDPEEASGIARQIGISDLKTAAWLQQGGDAISRQLDLAKEIGTFTEEDALAAQEYSMSMTVLTHSIKMGALPIFRAIVPILTDIAKGFRELVRNIEPSISYFGKMLGDVFTQISVTGAQALEFLSKHIIALTPLLAGLAGNKLAGVFADMATSIKQVVTIARAFIFSPWGAVLTALIAIGVVIEQFIEWLNGGDSALSEFFEAIFGNADNAKSILEDIYNGFMDIVAKFQDSFSELFSELIPHFEELGEALMRLFSAISESGGFDLLLSVFGLLLSVVVKVLGAISSAIVSFVGFLADNSGVIAEIIGFIIDVITSIVDVVTYVVEAISSAINALISIFVTLSAVVEQVGSTIMSIFNGISSAFSSLVGAVTSGASSIISSIQGILSNLAELASNSLLGKVIGSVGGSIYGAISRIGNTDNSSTVNTTNSNNTTNNNYYSYGGNGFVPPFYGYNAY